MKKYLTAAAVIATAACLFSCSGNSAENDETTAPREKDWHNSIEYEGSFYVNETTKLLYSLDRGTVTLWDDKGSGNVLQTLKYDSTVDDAMERVEFADENFDSNADIKILYDESNGKKYNLWLWNENKGQFDMCTKYKDIRDPRQVPEDKVIMSTDDNGVFGVLEKKFAFDEHMNITEVAASVIDESTVANNIAEKLSLGSTSPAESKVNIGKLECTAFITKDGNGTTTGYLAYDADGVWYADMGALGFYRSLAIDSDSIVLADYTEEAGQVQKLAAANFEGDIAITYKQSGYMSYENTDGSSGKTEAYRYTVTSDGEVCCYIVGANSSYWYISTDGKSYSKLNKNTMKIEDAVTDVFQANSEG